MRNCADHDAQHSHGSADAPEILSNCRPALVQPLAWNHGRKRAVVCATVSVLVQRRSAQQEELAAQSAAVPRALVWLPTVHPVVGAAPARCHHRAVQLPEELERRDVCECMGATMFLFACPTCSAGCGRASQALSSVGSRTRR